MTAPVAITTGEPAGIGPEVSLRAAAASYSDTILIGSETLLRQTASRLGLDWPHNAGVLDIPLAAPAEPGRLDVRNASYVLEILDTACKGALTGRFSAVCTAPVQKSIIIEAGIPFTGHTEYFAEMSSVPLVVMMLVSGCGDDALRVALATTHLPLAEVPAAITGDLLDRVTGILDCALKNQFGISSPKIAVTGLNPHAGESGHIGREEVEVIIPAISRAAASGISVSGPWPADTIFVHGKAEQFDAILCMYHDQGLPVLKREGFGHGVNVTLGLPWIRTSADHGTALDIAGRGCADPGSMIEALRLACRLAGIKAKK